MWELDCKESWALNNWCFLTVVLEKTLESPLDCKETQSVYPNGNQSWILEGLMMKLKRQYFGHLMGRTDSLEKTLMLAKIEGRWRRGCQRITWMDGVTNTMDMSLSKLRVLVMCRKPGVLQSMGCKELDMTEWLNWLTLFHIWYLHFINLNRENILVIDTNNYKLLKINNSKD